MRSVFEIAARHLHPALRRALARELWRRGLGVSEIARRTGLSKSLVSRYLSGERGGLIDPLGYPDVAAMIRDLADRVAENPPGPPAVEAELIRIALYMLSHRYLCGLHERIDPSIDPSKCNICPELFAAYRGASPGWKKG